MNTEGNIRPSRRSLYAWAMYDWANSAFATVVLAGFFPILYRDYFSQGRAEADITLMIGAANSLSAVLIFLLAPVTGSLSDAFNKRKLPLTVCMLTGCAMTAALAWIEPGMWRLAAAIYVIAAVAFALGNVFYDALITQISAVCDRAWASSLGFALGYLGGGLLLLALVYLVFNAVRFGFESTYDVMLFGFIATALWWLIFSLPLLVTVREQPVAARMRDGWVRLRATWSDLRGNPKVFWFLMAYLLYMDGVDTVIRMAVNYGQVLGFTASDLILALLLVQFIGFPATLAYSPLVRRFGTKPVLLFLIGTYVVLCVVAAQMSHIVEFFSLAVAIGLFQGGIQALSRSYFSQIIPPADAARFFGLYNVLGKAAVLLGPVTVGLVGSLSGSPRMGILSIVIFLLAGAVILLYKVREKEADE